MSILRHGGGKMKDYLSRYTLRVEQELLDKFGYIAQYEGRTKNRELEQMIKKRIADFEKEHGKIELKTEIMIEDLHNKMNHILTKESAILKLLQEEKEKPPRISMNCRGNVFWMMCLQTTRKKGWRCGGGFWTSQNRL